MTRTQDIQVGTTIMVPAGADFTRKTAYRLTITEVGSVVDGMACLHGIKLRANGAASARKDARMFAVLDTSKVSIA